MSGMLTVRINDELNQQLEALAEATKRTKSFLATEALERYVENEEWLLTEVREGQRQVRAGMTVSGDEMDELLASLEVERKEKPSKAVRPAKTTKTKRRAG
jgi:RHH-type transcriptional regulator, rel operon repressor / antitoxin RelB